MSTQQTVLLVGGSGRTCMRVLEQLLNRGIRVRVIVRSPQKFPISTAKHPNLSIVEANLLSLSDEDLLRHIPGCDAAISCLGHNISFNSIFFPPRDLVQQATARLCRVIETIRPDTRRGKFEKTFLWMLRAVLPPAKDNQQAANFLFDKIGTDNAFAQWTAVRPDTLLKGDVSEYILQENFVSSLFAPDNTNMANVAHFMCELVTNSEAWDRWKGKLPVITNA